MREPVPSVIGRRLRKLLTAKIAKDAKKIEPFLP